MLLEQWQEVNVYENKKFLVKIPLGIIFAKFVNRVNN